MQGDAFYFVKGNRLRKCSSDNWTEKKLRPNGVVELVNKFNLIQIGENDLPNID